nr:hypothetical protein [uncultured Mediterranean phage uvMED]
MATTVTITKNVTNVAVAETTTSVAITPQVTTVNVAELTIGQANTASAVSVTPNTDITSTNVQAAIESLAARNEITSDERSKLSDIEELADVTDTQNVVSALTAGSNVSIDADGTLNANVVGALTAGTNISIGDDGTISASSVSLTDVYTADSLTAHLALTPTPNQGDVVIRSDENKTYIHNGGTSVTMADYTELASNTNGVQSINNETGVVTFGKSDLNDYSANEFIDWTVSQDSVSLDIHADNYINTTYTAGTGISISAENVISATGGGSGGTSFTTGSNLNLTDNVLNTNEDISVKKVKFLDDDGTDSSVYMKAFQNTGGFAAFPDGIAIYLDGGDSPDSVVLALLDEFFIFTGYVDAQKGIRVNGSNSFYSLAKPGTGNASSDYHNSPGTLNPEFSEGVDDLPTDNGVRLDNVPANWDKTEYNTLLSSSVGTITRPTGTADYSIATTAFVSNTLAAFAGISIPDHNLDKTQFVKKDKDGVYTTDDISIGKRFNISPLNANLGQLTLYDPQDGTSLGAGTGGHFEAGTGVSFSVLNDNLVISASPDGLPEQSAGTDGYVLTSTNSVAGWLPIGTAAFPTQSSETIGKFLSSNGLTAQWASIPDPLPDQTYAHKKVLQSFNGNEQWANIDALPDQDANTYNKFLASSSSGALWSTPSSTIPTQTGHNGKFLTTDGTTLDWVQINTAGQTGSITFSSDTLSSSTDTVTIDDKLTATGQVTAPGLNLTGAGEPGVNSVSSFKVTAPNGLYINNTRVVESDLPLIKGQFTFTSGLSSFTQFQGNKLGSVYILTTDQFKYCRIQFLDISNLAPSAYEVDVQFHQTHISGPPVEVSTNVSKSTNGEIYIALRANGSHTDVPAGEVTVKIYVS